MCNSLRNMGRVPAFLMAEHALAVGRIEISFKQTVTQALGLSTAVSWLVRKVSQIYAAVTDLRR